MWMSEVGGGGGERAKLASQLSCQVNYFLIWHNNRKLVPPPVGVITKGTIIEVNVSELGLVTQGGKVIWGKYAQVTNHPENDGCINAVLLV